MLLIKNKNKNYFTSNNFLEFVDIGPPVCKIYFLTHTINYRLGLIKKEEEKTESQKK